MIRRPLRACFVDQPIYSVMQVGFAMLEVGSISPKNTKVRHLAFFASVTQEFRAMILRRRVAVCCQLRLRGFPVFLLAP